MRVDLKAMPLEVVDSTPRRPGSTAMRSNGRWRGGSTLSMGSLLPDGSPQWVASFGAVSVTATIVLGLRL
jgi:hypothetical protein